MGITLIKGGRSVEKVCTFSTNFPWFIWSPLPYQHPFFWKFPWLICRYFFVFDCASRCWELELTAMTKPSDWPDENAVLVHYFGTLSGRHGDIGIRIKRYLRYEWLFVYSRWCIRVVIRWTVARTVSGRRRLRKEARVEKLVTAETAFDGQPIRSKFLHLMRSVIQKNKPDFILLIHRS